MMVGLGEERVIGNLEQLIAGVNYYPTTVDARSTNARNVQPYGPAVPTDYAPQPFNCPPGADFGKSQEVGMCVGADYGPVARTAADGTNVYYDLTGAIAGTEPAAGGSTNIWLFAAVGLLLVLKMAK